MFERFKKYKLLRDTDKTLKDLELEFAQEKMKMVHLVSSDLFQLFIEYFGAKREINRDMIELLNPISKQDQILKLQGQNELILDVIQEVKALQVQD